MYFHLYRTSKLTNFILGKLMINRFGISKYVFSRYDFRKSVAVDENLIRSFVLVERITIMEFLFSTESSSSNIVVGSSSSNIVVGVDSEKKISLKELNRRLRATVVGEDIRRTRGAVTRQSTNSLTKKRWFDEVYNMSEERHVKRKRTQIEYNANGRKKLRVEQNRSSVVDDDGLGDVNTDARKFLKEYNARTQFWECGICGTDEGLTNLRCLDSAVRNVISKSDLPALLGTLKDSLRRGGCARAMYLQCIEQEFDDCGVLKSARYICNSCYMHLKRNKPVTQPNASSGADVGNREQNESLLKECGFMDIDSDVDVEERDDENDVVEEDDEVEEDASANESDGEEDRSGYGENLNAEINASTMRVKWSVPRTAYVRGLYPGIIPDELKDLRVVEMSMISIYNPVTRLKLNSKGMSYKYFHGHAHSYNIVNDLTSVAARLPWMPTINTFAILKYKNDVCVKELRYRPRVVRKALTWLKQHNPLYRDVYIAYPEEWNDLHPDAEVEPESMIIDTIDEEEVKRAYNANEAAAEGSSDDDNHEDNAEGSNDNLLNEEGMICC